MKLIHRIAAWFRTQREYDREHEIEYGYLPYDARVVKKKLP
jgi:hypothetical protein